MNNTSTISSSQLNKYILISIIGNGLEWYDFVIFGYFSPIFSKQFFPISSPNASLINIFAIFAIGFLSRPLGAYLFGKIGDLYGRKKALNLSIILMALSTCFMGLLPNYTYIGLGAPLLLTLFRIFQGISLGGEFTSSLSFLFEHSPAHRRGFVGACLYSGGFLGSILGALISLLLTTVLTEEQLYDWGWRLPFLLGVAIAFFGYYVRQKMEETPLFLELQKNHAINKSPLKTILRFNLKNVFQIVGILIPSTIWTYLFVFFPTYLVEKQVWKFSSSVLMNLIPAALFFLLMPIAGHISDLLGRKKMIFFGQLMLTISAPFFLIVFDSGNMLEIACTQFVVSLFFACSYAPTAALLAEVFPTAVRNTGSSIAYHISIGLFGGITPLLLIAASSLLGTKFGPNLLLIPAGFIGMISLFTMKKTQTILSNTYG